MESKYSYIVLFTVFLTNILTLGFSFGCVGVLVQYYTDKFSVDSSLAGAVSIATLMLFCEYPIINIKYIGLYSIPSSIDIVIYLFIFVSWFNLQSNPEYRNFLKKEFYFQFVYISMHAFYQNRPGYKLLNGPLVTALPV